MPTLAQQRNASRKKRKQDTFVPGKRGIVSIFEMMLEAIQNFFPMFVNAFKDIHRNFNEIPLEDDEISNNPYGQALMEVDRLFPESMETDRKNYEQKVRDAQKEENSLVRAGLAQKALATTIQFMLHSDKPERREVGQKALKQFTDQQMHLIKNDSAGEIAAILGDDVLVEQKMTELLYQMKTLPNKTVADLIKQVENDADLKFVARLADDHPAKQKYDDLMGVFQSAAPALRVDDGALNNNYHTKLSNEYVQFHVARLAHNALQANPAADAETVQDAVKNDPIWNTLETAAHNGIPSIKANFTDLAPATFTDGKEAYKALLNGAPAPIGGGTPTGLTGNAGAYFRAHQALSAIQSYEHKDTYGIKDSELKHHTIGADLAERLASVKTAHAKVNQGHQLWLELSRKVTDLEKASAPQAEIDAAKAQKDKAKADYSARENAFKLMQSRLKQEADTALARVKSSNDTVVKRHTELRDQQLTQSLVKIFSGIKNTRQELALSKREHDYLKSLSSARLRDEQKQRLNKLNQMEELHKRMVQKVSQLSTKLDYQAENNFSSKLKAAIKNYADPHLGAHGAGAVLDVPGVYNALNDANHFQNAAAHTSLNDAHSRVQQVTGNPAAYEPEDVFIALFDGLEGFQLKGKQQVHNLNGVRTAEGDIEGLQAQVRTVASPAA